MVTTRTPIDRPGRVQVTPRAVALWEQMQQVECTCTPRDWSRYWEHQRCDGCEEQNRLRRPRGPDSGAGDRLCDPTVFGFDDADPAGEGLFITAYLTLRLNQTAKGYGP